MRKIEFTNGQYYHIYNRGTEKRKIFLDEFDYMRFLLAMKLMNDEKDGLMFLWKNYEASHSKADLKSFLRLSLKKARPLVEICCYSLLPNHYHFILAQESKRGIEKFMHRIGVGHSMYFNKKYKRTGSLFQGTFKATHIKSNEAMLYLSAYVNCNSEVHGIREAESHRRCSFLEFIGKEKNGLCAKSKKIITSQFESIKEYKEFAKENVKYARRRKEDESEF
jgi:putative transposase